MTEFRVPLILIVVLATIAMLLSGCTTQPQVPASQTDADRFAKVYSELTGAYQALTLAALPSVPGAEPMLSKSRSKEILQQLDNVLAAVDAANALRITGQGGYENPETLAAILRAIRAQIPTGGSA